MNISLTCKYFLLHFPTQIKLFPLDIPARSTQSWTSTGLASCTSRTMCVCSPSVMTSSTGGLTRLCSTPAACEFYRQKRFLLKIDLFQRQVYWQARAADHWDGESCPHAGGGGCWGLRGRWVQTVISVVRVEMTPSHGIMGRRFPDGGLLRYRKWVPQQLGDVIVVTNSPPIGHMRSQLTNHQVGIILDVQGWSEKLY